MDFVSLRTKYLMLRARIAYINIILVRYEQALDTLSSVVARRDNRDKRGRYE